MALTVKVLQKLAACKINCYIFAYKHEDFVGCGLTASLQFCALDSTGKQTLQVKPNRIKPRLGRTFQNRIQSFD